MHRLQCGLLINAENMENKLYCMRDAVAHMSDLGAEYRISKFLQWAYCLACIYYLFVCVLTVMWKAEEKLFVQVKIIIPSFFWGIMIYVCHVFPFSFTMWWKLCRQIACVPQPNNAFTLIHNLLYIWFVTQLSHKEIQCLYANFILLTKPYIICTTEKFLSSGSKKNTG